MIPEILDQEPWLRDLLWQSSLCLGVAGLVAFGFRRQPARAHTALWLGMLGAVVTPVLTAWFRSRGWGWMAPLDATPDGRAALPVDLLRKAGVPEFRQPWWILGLQLVWVAVSGWLVIRALRSVFLGRSLLGRARRSRETTLQRAAAQAARDLELPSEPTVWESDAVACPNIWCWSQPPRILIPEDPQRLPRANRWRAVFCHELAHYKRRDHWTSLVADLAVCLMPWHPGMWWVRRWLSRLSEQAADRWVLSTGESRVGFAEALLGLVPETPKATLAAVSKGSGLAARVRSILEAPAGAPQAGFRWRAAMGAALLLATTSLALAQRRVPLRPVVSAPVPDVGVWEITDPSCPLRVYPTTLDFGAVPAGMTKTMALWLLNPSSQQVSLSEARAGCGCTTIHGFQPTLLEPGGALPLEVTMEAPSAVGETRDRWVTFTLEGLPKVRVPVSISAGVADSE